MKGLELLEKYPASAGLVRAWFLNQMIESFKDETVPDGFKDFMREQGVDNDKVGTLIDVNPRMLLDVFDENNIYIGTLLDESNGFWWTINGNKSTVGYEYRKNCEIAAIQTAFDILENKLTPKEETDETDNE